MKSQLGRLLGMAGEANDALDSLYGGASFGSRQIATIAEERAPTTMDKTEVNDRTQQQHRRLTMFVFVSCGTLKSVRAVVASNR